MMTYLSNWFHAYFVHFGFWVSFTLACTVYKDGAPEFKALPNLFKVAIVLSAILSLFSSHSQAHFLSFLK